jgi:hypothetical protein
MAGDWIKMRNDLPEDPAVIGIAAILSIDEFSVVGRLHKFWAWADRQSRDGHAVGVTRTWIDRYVHCDGFASALESFGWLVVTDRGISIPNFDIHNGDSAKQRCTATKRQQKSRAKASGDADETDLSRCERDKSVTREEKKREEINTPKAPKVAAVGFEKFWESYPSKVGKGAAQKAFAKVNPSQDLLQDMLRALADQKRSVRWMKDGGQFIPNPATWLNQERWLDVGAEAEAPSNPLQLFGGV